MPNTVVLIEGWDSAESWKAVVSAFPAGGFSTSSAGYSGIGKCLSLTSPTAYSVPYQVLTTSSNPTLGATWFIVSTMIKFAAGSSGSFYPCISFGSISATNGSPTSSSCRMAFGRTDRGDVFVRSSSAADAAIPGATLPSDQWLHLEYRHRYGNGTTGNWEVYVNGSLLWSGVGDNSGVTNPRHMIISGAASGGTVYFDDMVVAVSDDANPALIGRCEVRNYAPTSTAVGGWLGSDGDSTDNHLLVNSGLAASATNVQASAGSGLFDLYGHAAAPAAPLAVQVKAAASASALGVDDYSIVLRSGAQTTAKRRTIGTGAPQWMLSDLIATDPNTGSAWTKGGFDASTFGVKA